MPGARDVDLPALAHALKALSHDKRLDVLYQLTRPSSMDEVAAHLGVTRPAAEKHVEQLLELGAVRRQIGYRATGPVTEYVVVPQRVFVLCEELARIAVLKPPPTDGPTRAAPAPPAPAHASGPFLALVHGVERGRLFPLVGRGPWTIGREAASTVVLDYDPFVSGRHASVVVRAGKPHLVDEGSTNGSFVDWDPLPSGGSVELRPGSVVGVGMSLLVYKA